MSKMLLDNTLLTDQSFWADKHVVLPNYSRTTMPVKSLCFSAGRMAYGHTADILQDILHVDQSAGAMCGIETYAQRYCADLAASDYLMMQLMYENQKGKVVPKVQGAITSVLYVDGDTRSLTWNKLMAYARMPQLQFATINAPEGAYGVTYSGGDFAEPASKALLADMEEGTVKSDPAKWTAFARERYNAGLAFSLVSCTNFSGNGHVTGAAVRTIARAWEQNGLAPKGFLDYVSDPQRFAFPNCMIDRIAVPPDEKTQEIMDRLSIISNLVVTEKTRYWVIEDLFPAGRPDFEQAEGVIVESSYAEVKKYEDMKLRILNMSHSVIAGLGVLLGYRGKYGIYRAMQDEDISRVITRIIEAVIATLDNPRKMDPHAFARDAIERLNNPNIPDDPMRIALNGSTKMLPRFMDTCYAGREKGVDERELDLVMLPVAGFLRYTLGIDDQGAAYTLEDDPMKDTLAKAGSAATLGEPGSAIAFEKLIAHSGVMGSNLYETHDWGDRMQGMVAKMLVGPGSVRNTIQEYLNA